MELAEQRQGSAEVSARVAEVGLNAESLSEVRRSLLEPAPACERDSQIIVGLRGYPAPL